MAPRTKPTALVITADFGTRQEDGKPALSLSADGIVFVNGTFPGTLQQAMTFAGQVEAIPLAIAAMQATLTDARDPDTDTALARATVDGLTDALMAMGERT